MSIRIHLKKKERLTVKIRKLIWDKDLYQDKYTCNTQINQYSIQYNFVTKEYWLCHRTIRIEESLNEWPTLEMAKEAAQNHFNSLISSFIE